ncbi:MAG TPA: nucleoside recognition protein [Candidatus Desulfofervidus auxilii]|nr:nucleoside recognition protein [Candidatus Desulfofervidus auxilii]
MSIQPFLSALKYLSFMIPSMMAGVILINFIVLLGYLNRLSWLLKPIMKMGHLRSECAMSFITAFASPTAANTMLMELYQKGIISKKELFLSSMANSFPAILTHWRTMLPIIIPLLGWVGLVYFFILVVIGFFKTALVFFIGRFLLPPPSSNFVINKMNHSLPVKQAFKESLIRSKSVLKRIVLTTIPITILSFYLIYLGFFSHLTQWLRPVIHLLPLPPEALSIIVAQFGGHLPAYTLASNFLVNHLLGSKEVILALLWGTVVTSIVSLRYYLPYYWGIFGPHLGTQLMLISTGLRQILIIIIAIFIHWWF